MAPDMTLHDQHDEPPRRRTRSPGIESGGVGFAAAFDTWRAGMVNVEVSDKAGAHRVLIARFPRTKLALGGGLVAVMILGLPWIIVPLSTNDSGLPSWAISLAVVLVLVLVLGWILVPLLITAVRGGYLALAPTGVVIRDGLGSVLIPWAAIESVAADYRNAAYPVLRLHLRSDSRVPGWPWPAALSSALVGSSRRTLRIMAWWFQPVPLNWLVGIIRFLLAHPEERQRVGDVDPDGWDLVPAQE